jgi:hypothetical protein
MAEFNAYQKEGWCLVHYRTLRVAAEFAAALGFAALLGYLIIQIPW